MFGFGKNSYKHSELEKLKDKVEINMGNNYKDASKEAFNKLKAEYERLLSERKLSSKQEAYYETVVKEYEKELKNFTHK